LIGNKQTREREEVCGREGGLRKDRKGQMQNKLMLTLRLMQYRSQTARWGKGCRGAETKGKEKRGKTANTCIRMMKKLKGL
jgi:hypothetical protein